MKHRAFTGLLLGVLAALALAALAWPVLAGPAQAPAMSDERIVAPVAFDGTSPHVIPAAAFKSEGFDPDSSFFSFGGGYWTGDAAAYGCLIAPAHLPASVRVTDMFATVYDNDGSRNVTVTLRRMNNFTGVGTTMAAATSAGAFAGTQVIADATIDEPDTVYPDYSYYVTLCLGSSNLRLYSVRLYYLPIANLSLTKSDNIDPVPAGASLRYRLTVTNNGPQEANSISVNDPLPAGVEFISMPGSCSRVGLNVTCTTATLAAGASVSFNIWVRPVVPGTLANTATVSGGVIDLNSADNSDTENTTVKLYQLFVPATMRR